MNRRLFPQDVEQLEARAMLSLTVPADFETAEMGAPIDFFAVALHEIGHSLGLQHSDPNDGIASIMDPFYTGPVSGLAPQDIQRIQDLYPESGPSQGLPGERPWNSPDITYSYIKDLTKMEQGEGRSFLNADLNNELGSEAVWKGFMEAAFQEWADASTADGTSTVLTFTEVIEARRFPADFNGDTQGDSRFGDIRIGSHRFDGPSGTLAHAYFPPPNGRTIAGDIHFDHGELWADLSAGAINVSDAAPVGAQFDSNTSYAELFNRLGHGGCGCGGACTACSGADAAVEAFELEVEAAVSQQNQDVSSASEAEQPSDKAGLSEEPKSNDLFAEFLLARSRWIESQSPHFLHQGQTFSNYNGTEFDDTVDSKKDRNTASQHGSEPASGLATVHLIRR